MQYSAVLCCAVLYSAVLCCAVMPRPVKWFYQPPTLLINDFLLTPYSFFLINQSLFFRKLLSDQKTGDDVLRLVNEPENSLYIFFRGLIVNPPEIILLRISVD